MQVADRRHDIDWLRVIAIGLLLFFHTALVFQPWGTFIQSDQSLGVLQAPVRMLAIWRIPLLFFVSGMGLCFASRRRTFRQLLGERTRRILTPTLVGVFLVVPVHALIEQNYHERALTYAPDLWHLWFLAYIYAYVLLWGYALYCLRREDNALRQGAAARQPPEPRTRLWRAPPAPGKIPPCSPPPIA